MSDSAAGPDAGAAGGNWTSALRKLTKLVDPGKVRSGTSKFSSSYTTPLDASGLKAGPNVADVAPFASPLSRALAAEAASEGSRPHSSKRSQAVSR